MIQLESIKISNARKLGRNVKIDFGEGATIIVAPNGTGKTTIFEAIELAITSEIRRLQNQIGAVVSDGADSMFVQLEFSDQQVVKVELNKNGSKNIEGYDIRKVLNVSEDISLPYLFRMTHFFEQNSKNWFVECDETEAGRLLSSLPIGSDLQNVQVKKTSLLKAFTTLKSKMDMELASMEKDYKNFEELLKEKEKLPISISDIVENDLMTKIKELTLKYKVKVSVSEDRINVLSVEWGLVKNEIVKQKDVNASAINKLSAFVNKIELYQERQSVITEIKNTIVLKKRGLAEKEKEVQKYSEQKNNYQTLLNAEAGEEAKTNQIISDFKMAASMKEKIKIRQDDIETYKIVVNDMALEYKKYDEVIKIYLDLSNRQKNLHEEIKVEKEKLIDLQKKERNLKNWKEKKSKISEFNITKSQVESDLEKAKGIRHNAEHSLRSAEQDYQKIKDHLVLLRKSEEESLAALSVIRKQIKPDTRICPVCQAEYGYGELDKRITKALESLNPVLMKVAEDEEEASAIVMQRRDSLMQEETKLKTVETLYKNIQEELEELILSIDRIRKELLIEEEDIDHEQIMVVKEIAEQNSRITELQDKQNQLPLLNVEEYQNAKKEKEVIERKQEETRKQIVSIEREIESTNNDIELFNRKLEGKNQEEEIKKRELHTQAIGKYRDLISICDENLNTLYNETNELKRVIAANEDEECSLHVSQSVILNEWKEFDIGDTPSKDAVEKEIARLKEKDLQFEKDLQCFHTLQDDLTLLKGFHDRTVIEGKLTEQAGNTDIEQYHKKLLDLIQRKKDDITNIEEKRKAVETFFGEVTSQSHEIQRQLRAMNDIWKRILKQMAVTSLITSAPLLDNKVVYNKPKARTKALIHNEEVDIVKMASEGQITDLQLSFMLAMNTKYSWTPWKALLLDDPMQHHDLVHTSSVLDVLRDYIADFDYQILLSTHDLLQADYFFRKFQNDGIKCKIYQLVSREGGVMADQIR